MAGVILVLAMIAQLLWVLGAAVLPVDTLHLAAPAPPPPIAAGAVDTSTRRLDWVAQDGSSIRVSRDDWSSSATVGVTPAELRAAVTHLKPRDHVQVMVRTIGTGLELIDLRLASRPTSSTARLLALFGAAIVLFLILRLGLGVRFRDLIIGADNRYSNSKTQMVFWFLVLVVTYIAALALRVAAGGTGLAGGVDMPRNLLLLSGLSAITFGAAKGITTSQLQGGARKSTAGAPSFPGDLVRDDQGKVDVADCQMLVMTALAVVSYLVQSWGFLGDIPLIHGSLPNVDSTILASFGLGQGAYLVKKWVGDFGAGGANPGPPPAPPPPAG